MNCKVIHVPGTYRSCNWRAIHTPNMCLKPSAEFVQSYTCTNLGLFALGDKVLSLPSFITLILYVSVFLIAVARSCDKDPGVCSLLLK
jgi:hypothetical protein